jgi:aconitase A
MLTIAFKRHIRPTFSHSRLVRLKAGPGVSGATSDVSVSAINRNFPGRSGPGKVYLASPRVVAASALAGYITTPEAMFDR